MSSNSGKQRSSCLMIGTRCTRDTFCQTIAKTSANDLLDKGKFCQNGQIFKGADVLPQGRTSHDKLHSKSIANCRGSRVVGRSRGLWVWVKVVGNKKHLYTVSFPELDSKSLFVLCEGECGRREKRFILIGLTPRLLLSQNRLCGTIYLFNRKNLYQRSIRMVQTNGFRLVYRHIHIRYLSPCSGNKPCKEHLE